MEIIVRKARIDDYNTLCELFDEIDALHRHHLPHLFQKPNSAAREQDYLSEQITDEDIGLFVAEAGKELIGLVHAVIIETPDFPVFVPRRYASVNNIVVKAGFQNHGIGKLLIEKIQAWAVAKGATSLELNVYEFNETAIAFYEKVGFQSVSRKMSKKI